MIAAPIRTAPGSVGPTARAPHTYRPARHIPISTGAEALLHPLADFDVFLLDLIAELPVLPDTIGLTFENVRGVEIVEHG